METTTPRTKATNNLASFPARVFAPITKPIAPPEPPAERERERLAKLTKREVEVLRMIEQGLSRHEMAEAVFLSAKTIDAHRAAVMQKLDLHSQAQLILFAIRHRLVEVDYAT